MMAAGVSAIVSARFVAVTTISSRVPAVSAAVATLVTRTAPMASASAERLARFKLLTTGMDRTPSQRANNRKPPVGAAVY